MMNPLRRKHKIGGARRLKLLWILVIFDHLLRFSLAQAYPPDEAELLRQRVAVANELSVVFSPLLLELHALCEAISSEGLVQRIEQVRISNYWLPPIRFMTFNNLVVDDISDSGFYETGNPATQDPAAAAHFLDLKLNNRSAIAKSRLQSYRTEVWRRFTGRFDTFLVMLPKPGNQEFASFSPQSMNRDLYPALTPIGEYGEVFSRRILLATAVLRNIAVTELDPAARRTTKAHAELLAQETARGKDGGESGGLDTVLEGIISIGQSITQMLPRRVGDDDFREALRKIQLPPVPENPNGLIIEYVRRLGMGVVGPLTLNGSFYENSLVARNGVFELEPNFRNLISSTKALRNELQKQSAQGGERLHGETGVVCPVTIAQGGKVKVALQYTIEDFYRIFTIVDRFLAARGE
jgi:hypothetical protein